MRTTTLVAAALAGAGLIHASPALAEDEGYRHGRVRFVETGVTLHRATEVSAEEALANLPFLPGDRVWSDADGRAEFQFPDGTLVRLDSRSKLDYAGHEESGDERIVLRLWSGSLIARLRARDSARFEVETPAGSLELLDAAMVRVDVEAGEVRVSVYRGEAVLDDGRSRVRLAAGERTFARWGEAAETPEAFDIALDDDFARWDDAREGEEHLAARSSEYLPTELDPYAGELERNGSWRFEASVGYVWTPRVAVGWSPYANGHWSWTPYGWTWVPYETWGWAPFHYGRWGFSASFGWYWAPGRVWGPGWVSWGVGGGYVGWCPLGFRDRPVYPWSGHYRGGHAVPRRGGHGGWNVVREGDFGGRDVARRRVPLAGVDPGALRVADSPNLRPTRDARALLASNPSSRAISRRPTPGDFVRELAVDNKTTIPSPWLRRGRDGAALRAGRDTQERGNAGRQGTARQGTARQGTARQGTGSGGAGGSSAASRSERGTAPRASRAVPWYTPRSREREAARDDSSAQQRGASERRDTSAYRRDESSRARSTTPSLGASTRDDARNYRARPERIEAPARDTGEGRSRYRSTPERRSEGRSYQPRPEHREAPAQRSEPRAQPRTESRAPRQESSARSSRGDSGARQRGGGGGERSSGDTRSGGGRGAARPPRG